MTGAPALTPSHVTLRVADLDRAEAFYQALGFETTYRAAPDPSFAAVLAAAPGEALSMAAMARDGYRIELVQIGPSQNPDPARSAGEFGLRHLALRVANLEQVAAAITAAGGGLDAESRVVNGLGRFAIGRDPDGARLLLIQPAT